MGPDSARLLAGQEDLSGVISSTSGELSGPARKMSKMRITITIKSPAFAALRRGKGGGGYVWGLGAVTS